MNLVRHERVDGRYWQNERQSQKNETASRDAVRAFDQRPEYDVTCADESVQGTGHNSVNNECAHDGDQKQQEHKEPTRESESWSWAVTGHERVSIKWGVMGSKRLMELVVPLLMNL